jgi:stearoyl-CoA desaturase (delta-9 desaturase)
LLFLFSVLAYLAAFGLVLALTSIGYHRALCHQAVKLHPLLERLVLGGGVWLTGIDATAWVVLHRQHHRFSDGPRDPHAPRNYGWRGMLLAQIRGYNSTVDLLIAGDPELTAVADGLRLSWPARRGFWWAPYFMQAVVAGLLITVIPWPLVLATWLGLVSHAVQGATVNFFGHSVGRRRYDLDDDSRNNRPVAWLLMGEGYQNNHHQAPASARFAHGDGEWDPGYMFCRLLERVGLLRIAYAQLTPPAPGVS